MAGAVPIKRFIEAVPASDRGDGNTYSGDVFVARALKQVEFNRILPRWWSRSRDVMMRDGWRDDGMLLSAYMYAAQNKIVNMPIKVVARDPNIESHNKQARELNEQFHALSEYGNGLAHALSKFSEDMFATDNGAFFEVVGEGDVNTPLESIPLGVRHLDSLYVTRYNDPIYPYGYLPRKDSKELRYHHSRIISVSQMPSAARSMNNVGYCAVSRSIEIAQRFADMNRYLRGKIGGVSAKKILVGKNISGEEILTSMVAGVSIAEALGELDVETIAIGGMDVELDAVDIYNYPELNEKEAVLSIMLAMAIAWGLELNEVYPLQGSKSGDEVALQRSRGKMPAAFVGQLERQMSFRLVPRHLKVVIEHDDDLQDKEQAIIDDINARKTERLVASGVVSTWMSARGMFKEGRLTDTEFLELSLDHNMLPDGTPVQRVFYDDEFESILTVDPAFISGDADPNTVRTAIAQNRMLLYAAYPKTTSQAFHRRCRIAFGALDWLEKLYGLNVPISLQTPEQEEDSPRSEDSEEDEGGTTAAREEASQTVGGAAETL